jgi:enamine deaminase RidA (YjgF/YER057c/UK114 family)
MHKQLAPENLRTNPNYSQGIETAPGMRMVAVAGQTGSKKDGSVPDGIGAQADLAWANVMAVLAEAGMGPEDIIHYTSYLVAGAKQEPYDEARLRHLGDARPASTKIFVSGLARPRMLCEVQVFAAAPA